MRILALTLMMSFLSHSAFGAAEKKQRTEGWGAEEYTQTQEEGTTLASNVFMLKGGADLKEIVDGFNKIGASSKDLIEVLKAVKTAGALHAELVIR